jgi:multidrug efflux pump subunit AcrA (membrane-fusion protein)
MNEKGSRIHKGKAMKSKIVPQLKVHLLTICLGGILLFALAGCSQNPTSTPATTVTPVVSADTVTAEGHLQPVTSTWLSFQASGRVDELLVKEGDAVKKDQPLIRLEGSDLAEANLTAAQSSLFLAQQNLNDAKNSDSMKADAELKLAQAQTNYNTALGNYWNRKDTQGNDQQIALYNANVTIAQDKVKTLQDRLATMGELKDTDVAKATVIAELNQALIDLDNTKKIRDYYQNLPDTLDVQTLQAKLDTAKSALSDAQRDYDRLKDGPSKESLAALQTAADAAQASADQAQWTYDQLVLKAPYDGTFVQCDLTVGQFVSAGTQAALVADFSQWMVETDDLDEIGEAEIDISKPVTITADALPGQTFNGTVDHVVQNYTDKNSDILYTAKVKLNGNDPKLMWGMTMQLEFQK